MIAGLEDGQKRRHLRGHAGGAGQGGTPSFEGGDALLQHRDGGVADAAVDVAEGLQVEQAGGVLGRVKDEAGGLMNRCGAGPSHRVRHGAGVDGAGAKAVVAVLAHLNTAAVWDAARKSRRCSPRPSSARRKSAHVRS